MSILQRIQERRAEMKESAARAKMTTKEAVKNGWIQMKDFLLIMYLLNTLTGLAQQVDIASLMQSEPKTILINQVAEAKEEEKEEAPKEESKLLAEVTAYNSEVAQTDNDPFTMASGKRVYKGAIACPAKYPFGTKVEMAGEIYTCEDRMNIRYREGEYFDIWMESKEEAKKFGRQKVEYTIIK